MGTASNKPFFATLCYLLCTRVKGPNHMVPKASWLRGLVASWPRGDVVSLAILFALFAAWSAWFVSRTAFRVDGELHFCLFDDAMISMTYARNLVQGYGLNWARWGSPVEGFTCPLWTFLMVPVNALGLGLAHRSLVVQFISALVLLAHLLVVRRLVRRHFVAPSARHWMPAVVLTAFYYPLNYWSLMGMETGLQALLTSAAVLFTLDIVRADSPRFTRLFCVLTTALLLRPDMLLLVLACLFVIRKNIWQTPPRAWVGGACLLLLLPASYLVFRVAYFGDILPNTYYLKMTGVPMSVRVVRGAMVFLEFARPILVPLLVVFVGCLPLRRRRPEFVLPLAIVILYFAYSIYVGGDAWEANIHGNRFIAPVMPMLFVLVNALLNRALCSMSERSPGTWAGGVRTTYVVAGTVALCLLLFNGLWPHKLWQFTEEHEKKRWQQMFVLERPFSVENHRTILHQLRTLKTLAKKDALVATSWAGIPAFFTDFRMVDIYGYNNRKVARMPSARKVSLDNARAYFPGHMKFDYDYLLGEVRPDVLHFYLNPHPRADQLRTNGYVRYGEVFRLRSDSTALRSAGQR